MVNTEELIGTTEHVTLCMRCRLNRCGYKRVQKKKAIISVYNINSTVFFIFWRTKGIFKYYWSIPQV